MLILLTCILVVVLLSFFGGFFWFLYRYKRQQDFAARIQEAVTVEELDLEGRLINIENKIETLTNICLELKGRLHWLEQQVGVIVNRQVRAGSQISAYEAVYKAYDQGKRLTDLAREFGRGKGEIELILNLRRIRKEG
ncbi:MAG: hypothetical protein AB1426_05995 [Bacillota bacterium]